MNPEDIDDEVDLLVEEALCALGAAPLDPPDEDERACEFAGEDPWLEHIVRAHPHNAAVLASLRGEVMESDFPGISAHLF